MKNEAVKRLTSRKQDTYNAFERYSSHTLTAQKTIVSKAYKGTIKPMGASKKAQAQLVLYRNKRGVKGKKIETSTFLGDTSSYGSDTLKNVIQAYGIEALRISLGVFSIVKERYKEKDEDGYIDFTINEILDVAGYNRMKSGRHVEKTRRRVGRIIALMAQFPILTRYKQPPTKSGKKREKWVYHRSFVTKELDIRYEDGGDLNSRYAVGGKIKPEESALASTTEMLIHKRALTTTNTELGIVFLVMLKLKNEEYVEQNPYRKSENRSNDDNDFQFLLTWNDIHEYLFANTKRGETKQIWRNKKNTMEALEHLKSIKIIKDFTGVNTGFLIYITKDWKNSERAVLIDIINTVRDLISSNSNSMLNENGYIDYRVLEIMVYEEAKQESIDIPHDIIDICINKAKDGVEKNKSILKVID